MMSGFLAMTVSMSATCFFGLEARVGDGNDIDAFCRKLRFQRGELRALDQSLPP